MTLIWLRNGKPTWMRTFPDAKCVHLNQPRVFRIPSPRVGSRDSVDKLMCMWYNSTVTCFHSPTLTRAVTGLSGSPLTCVIVWIAPSRQCPDSANSCRRKWRSSEETLGERQLPPPSADRFWVWELFQAWNWRKSQNFFFFFFFPPVQWVIWASSPSVLYYFGVYRSSNILFVPVPCFYFPCELWGITTDPTGPRIIVAILALLLVWWWRPPCL